MMSLRSVDAVKIVMLSVSVLAPSSPKASTSVAVPPSGEPAQFRVGTARVDVTPPPGPATFGHGPDAHVTNGYWTRLYCRVFVIQSTESDRHAIIPCDLAAISDVLHHAVASRTGRMGVSAPRLILTATHTHAGPGHYFETPAYGGAGSSRRPGYDEKMLTFLAERIAQGVEQAVGGLRPAAARWMHTAKWGLSRNRSVIPFHANDPSTFTPRTPPDAPRPSDELAIDPALDVLQFDEINTASPPDRIGPIGWLIFFGMHPTVLPSSNRLFGADVDGVASRQIESRLRRIWAEQPTCHGKENDPLAGFVNTNEGDLSPIWHRGDVPEAIEVGGRLAAAALSTLNLSVPVSNARSDGFRTDLIPESRYLEVDLPGKPLPRGGGALCPIARLGGGAGHGGSDHPTSIDGLLPAGSDIAAPDPTDCHSPKPQLLGAGSFMIVGFHPASFFPTHVTFALVHLGDTWISFVPAELTVHAGAAVNRAVLDSIGAQPGPGGPTAIVGGLANSYMQYVATRAEYQFQAYEGASTLYGPSSADFFAQTMSVLALDLIGKRQPQFSDIGKSVNASYTFGPRRDRFPSPDKPPKARFEPLSLCTIEQTVPPAICFRWTHGDPGQVPLTRAPWIELIRGDGQPFHLADAGGCEPGTPIDDRGIDFQTRVRERRNGVAVWSTLFQPTINEWNLLKAKSDAYRLHARGDGSLPSVTSDAFSFTARPQRCTAIQVQYCLGHEQEWRETSPL